MKHRILRVLTSALLCVAMIAAFIPVMALPASAAGEYVETGIADIGPLDEVVITMTKNNVVYALTNGGGTSSAPKATVVTASGNALTGTIADDLKWNIVQSDDGIIIYPNGDTSKWLYSTSVNNGIRVGTNDQKYFKIESDYNYLYHIGQNRYVGVYDSADWRSYTSMHSNISGETLTFYVCKSEVTCAHGTLSDTYTYSAGKDATCTDAGTKEYWYCSVCGDYFADLDATTEIADGIEISAEGHNFNGDSKCDICDEICLHEGTTHEVDKAPTCVETGKSADAVCADCGSTVPGEDIPATGKHTYANGVCSVCGEEEKKYSLVTDASSLKAGDKIIIVASDSDVAMSTTQNNNNRPQVDITKDSNSITPSADVQIITLETGNKTGTFAFKVDGGYLYAASSKSNNLKTENTLSDNSSWTITITADGVATVKAQGTNTRNLIKYNSSSSIFSCYGSGQKDISIYKLEEDETPTTPAIPDVTFNTASVSVASSFALNFFISEANYNALTAYGDYKVTLTMDASNYAPIELTDAQQDATYGYYYSFTGINPMYLANEVTAVITDADGNELAKSTYSVKQYCVDQLASTDNAELKAVLSNILYYGEAASKYAGTTVDYTSGVTNIVDTTKESLTDNGATGTQDDVVKWQGVRAVMTDTVNLRIYFTSTDAGVTASSSVTLGDVKQEGDMYYVETQNISLGAMCEDFTIKVGNATFTYSVAKYASKMQDKEDDFAPVAEQLLKLAVSLTKI